MAVSLFFFVSILLFYCLDRLASRSVSSILLWAPSGELNALDNVPDVVEQGSVFAQSVAERQQVT